MDKNVIAYTQEDFKSYITINPKLPIGTELWIMYNNKPTLCLISGIVVNISAYDEKDNRGLYHQLFGRRLNRKAKEYFNYTYFYQCKVEGFIQAFDLTEKDGQFFLLSYKIYTTKEELIKSIN